MFNHEPASYKCPLCMVVQGEENDLNKPSDLVFQSENVMAFISPKWWINNPGNVMVITNEHTENIYSISKELLSEVYSVGQDIAIAMKETYGCDGISFRQHNEPAGNQDIWHFHMHVFPRWKNDDLYLNHKNSRIVSSEERLPYAEKLRNYFKK